MIKYIGQKGRQLMFIIYIYNRICREEETPNDWKESLIVPIYKNKGKKKECNNQRGLSLLSTAMKIFQQIVDKRCRAKLKNMLYE